MKKYIFYKLLIINSVLGLSISPSFASYSPNAQLFGGNGSSGAVSLGSNITTATQYNAVTLTASTAISIASGCQFNSTGAFTTGGNTWTINTAIAPSYPGTYNTTQAYWYQNSGGLSPGSLGVNSNNSGQGHDTAGGGFGGAGGNSGQSNSAIYQVGYGGPAVPLTYGACGSSGASGVGSGGSLPAPTGGSGGGMTRICSATTITISTGGAINAIGGAGISNGGSNICGGAGGSGGGIYEYALIAITQTGTTSVAGGAGGANGGSNSCGGSGGGGGYHVQMAGTLSGSGTDTVIGGTHGTDGVSVSVASNNGSSGVSLKITGTPSYPVIAEHEREWNDMVASGWQESNHIRGHEALMFAIPRAVDICKGGDGTHIVTTQKDHITLLASINAKNWIDYQNLCFLYNEGEQLGGQVTSVCLGIGDSVVSNDVS